MHGSTIALPGHGRRRGPDAAAQHDVRPPTGPALRELFRAARNGRSYAVLEGLHALKHALRFGAATELVVTPDRRALLELAGGVAPDLVGALTDLAVEIPGQTFAELAPQPPRTGVLALAHRPTVDAEALLAAPGVTPIVLLQRPNDLGNIGACVRVAAAAGAASLLTTGRHDPWHPAALRGAAGLHFALPVARIERLPPLARPLIALHGEGEPIGGQALPPGAVLAFGSERDGLDTDWLARADRVVAIPMRPGVSSLNLATAVAVALYAGRWPGGP
jgi:tRNA G18 (ribose-2'-O)-methylase SpoU